MPAEFYISDGVGLASNVEIAGPIEDLAKHVNEFAAVEWDKFCEKNIVDVDTSMRFVCAGGVWRAFTGIANGTWVERDGFVAQWWPSGDGGEWRRERTSASKKTAGRQPSFMGGEK